MTSLLLPSRSLLLSSSGTLPLLHRLASTKSQDRWVARQASDHLVSARGSFRARSAFKLIELHEHYKIFRPSCKSVIDLGAAPGSWSQVAKQHGDNADKRIVIAVDLLPIQPIPGVYTIQGDFLDQKTHIKIRHVLMTMGDGLRLKADVVVSDMGANMSGNASRDQEESWKLCQSVFEFCKVGLRVGHFHVKDGLWRKGGTLVLKHFACPEIDAFRRTHLVPSFEEVFYNKPEASRKESAEGYFVCRGYRGDVMQKAIEAPPKVERWAEDDE